MYLTDEYKQKVLDKPWGNSFIIINLIHCLFQYMHSYIHIL